MLTGWTSPHGMLPFPEYSAWILALMMVSGLHCKRISKTVIISEMLKWVDAEKACRTEGPDCHLAVGEGEESIQWDTVSISDSQHWIGAKRQRIVAWRESGRPLFKATGCYRTSTSLGNGRTLPQNNPDECFQTCRTQFVALQVSDYILPGKCLY
ncbi:uncharacterized protein LOC112566349 [Pomacea canaliculata]|uniref:uncharacterized protein LOC112566349 n=1 Tax=Pomacea canaliculata TaxID=400727 RepID=UPI000D72FCD6|nr:uncharacterized protein LOC112566349 [Pomacea canaliculata]